MTSQSDYDAKSFESTKERYTSGTPSSGRYASFKPRDVTLRAPLASDWTNRHVSDSSGLPSRLAPRKENVNSDVDTGVSGDSGDRAYSRDGMRTILLSGLLPGCTHLDVANAVRGGQLVEIYLKYSQRTASVTFVHPADAKEFYEYASRYGVFVKQKRVHRLGIIHELSGNCQG